MLISWSFKLVSWNFKICVETKLHKMMPISNNLFSELYVLLFQSIFLFFPIQWTKLNRIGLLIRMSSPVICSRLDVSIYLSLNTRKYTFWNVRPTTTPIGLRIRAVWSESSLFHQETQHHWLSKMRPAKILIRLRECAGWSESSPDAHVQRYVFWRYGSYKEGLSLETYLYWFRRHTSANPK